MTYHIYDIDNAPELLTSKYKHAAIYDGVYLFCQGLEKATGEPPAMALNLDTDDYREVESDGSDTKKALKHKALKTKYLKETKNKAIKDAVEIIMSDWQGKKLAEKGVLLNDDELTNSKGK